MPVGNSLVTAAAYGDLHLVKSLLTDGKSLVDDNAINRRSEEGFLPLCIAAFWGFEAIVKLLLQHGADIDGTNSGTEHTAMHCATLQGHKVIIETLLSYHPELNLEDTQGRTPIDFASASEHLWPLFESRGCSRTPKKKLIQMGFLRKIDDREEGILDKEAMREKQLAHFSRPGSAYVIDPAMASSKQSSRRSRESGGSSGLSNSVGINGTFGDGVIFEEMENNVQRLTLDKRQNSKEKKMKNLNHKISSSSITNELKEWRQ